ncbi:hypothetical protein [Polynucleobacter sp.]|uniref:hypothetical protein n=1 Tax=Polynucleobacter sp. TaxID=2029855 RepID=UPI003F6A2891
MITFTAGDIIKSADLNSNFDDLSSGLGDDTNNSLDYFRDEALYDFVISGGVIVKNGALTIDVSACVAMINGQRILSTSVSAHSVTASKDIYVDILNNGDLTGTIVYTEVANNAASPSLAANSIRLGVVQAGASITSTAASINQGQPEKVVPIASSIPYTTTDSLGNIMYPTDPRSVVIGYRQITSDATATPGANTYANVTGLSVPVIIPSNLAYAQIRFTFGHGVVGTAGAAATTITVGVRESTTELFMIDVQEPVTAYKTSAGFVSAPMVATAGLHTYLISMKNSSASSHTLYASAARPAYLLVELIR